MCIKIGCGLSLVTYFFKSDYSIIVYGCHERVISSDKNDKISKIYTNTCSDVYFVSIHDSQIIFLL